MKNVKTTCCNAIPQRKGRANYHCPVCGKDVTLELYFINEIKSKKKKKRRNRIFHIPICDIIKFRIKYPIMKWLNDKTFSGACECGHSFEDHHGSMIGNLKYVYSPRGYGGRIGQECEYSGCNGEVYPDENGFICRCNSYVDRDWVFKINKNYKYRIDYKNLLKLIL